VPAPDVAKLWHGPSGLIEEARDPTSYVKIPQDLLNRYDAYVEEWRSWSDRRPTLVGDPDYAEAKAIERQREALWYKAYRLRLRLLKIRTTSPRGLLLKVALATETERFEDFDKRFRRPRYYATFDICEDLMTPLLADLRAMVGAQA